MAHKTVTRVSKPGTSFATWQDALAAFKTAIAARETVSGASVKMTVADNADVQRTLSLLEDGTGFEIVDVWTSSEAMDEYYASVRPTYQAAGWQSIGEGVDGWSRTVVSSEAM